jgi:hypothetical protein
MKASLVIVVGSGATLERVDHQGWFWRHGSDLTGRVARVVIALLALLSGG